MIVSRPRCSTMWRGARCVFYGGHELECQHEGRDHLFYASDLVDPRVISLSSTSRIYHHEDPADDGRTLCGIEIWPVTLDQLRRAAESVAIEKWRLRLCDLCAKAES